MGNTSGNRMISSLLKKVFGLKFALGILILAVIFFLL
jgi:uncharacterized membrane protein YciS (DUF1049 family)